MAFERTAYLMLFILGLCLLAGPGAAREISAGDTIFAYEDSRTLDFSALNRTVFEATGEELTRLTRYDDDDPESGQLNQFALVNQDGVLTTTTNLASYPYDADDFGTYFAGTPTYTTDFKVYLCEPRLTPDNVLADDHATSVVGRTVTPAPPPPPGKRGSSGGLPGVDSFTLVTAVCIISVALRRLFS